MERDMIGYGQQKPLIIWPNNAKLAVNFVINYEEGAENTPINGDSLAESYGGEFSLALKPPGVRNLSMESLFEYGSRVGIWRLIDLFVNKKIPITFFITGLALQLNPELATYLSKSPDEVAGHGWRWYDYALISREEEKQHILRCINTITAQTGKKPLGWYTGRRSENTTNLLAQIGGFTYHSDSYADDLPYYEKGLLTIPYTLDCNDFRYTTIPGFSTADDFLHHLKHCFDVLYQEKTPNLMTIALHPRLSGRPGRSYAIEQFINYISAFPQVWITTRLAIAQHCQSLLKP